MKILFRIIFPSFPFPTHASPKSCSFCLVFKKRQLQHVHRRKIFRIVSLIKTFSLERRPLGPLTLSKQRDFDLYEQGFRIGKYLQMINYACSSFDAPCLRWSWRTECNRQGRRVSYELRFWCGVE